jgi:hypothetical protein
MDEAEMQIAAALTLDLREGRQQAE